MAALCCLALLSLTIRLSLVNQPDGGLLRNAGQPCKSPLNIHQTIRANNSFWKNVQMLSGHSLALLQGAISIYIIYILRWFHKVSNALFMIWGFSYWRFTSSSLFLHCGCPCPPFVKNMKLLQNVMPTDLHYFVQLWVVRLSSISNFCLWFTSHQLMYNKNIQIHTNIYHILYMRDVSHQDAKHTTTVKLREWSTDMLLYKFRTPSIETGPWLWQWLPLEWRALVLLFYHPLSFFCLGIADTNSGKSWRVQVMTFSAFKVNPNRGPIWVTASLGQSPFRSFQLSASTETLALEGERLW